MKKLLLLSDAPGSPTGLGGQASIIYNAATKAGFHVTAGNLCIPERHEYPPRVVHAPGMVPMYLVDVPAAADHLGYILTELRPDQIVCLADGWMLGALHHFPQEILDKVHFWTTADHELFPEAFRGFMESIGSLIFMSDFGAASWGPGLNRHGKRTETIYHGVDPKTFRPLPPSTFEAQRKALGTFGHFILAHVGRNQWRKQQPLLIEAWVRFVRGLRREYQEKVTLYLHTEEYSAPSIPAYGDPVITALSALFSGWNLKRFIQKYYTKEEASTIRFSERGATKDQLVALYNIADAHALVSVGEGFGVPLIEAQACGTPNISADNTTTPEIVGGNDVLIKGMRVYERSKLSTAPFGWRVPCNSFQVQPDFSGKRPLIDVDAMADAIFDAFEHWRLGQLKSQEAIDSRVEWTLEKYSSDKILQQWEQICREF